MSNDRNLLIKTELQDGEHEYTLIRLETDCRNFAEIELEERNFYKEQGEYREVRDVSIIELSKEDYEILRRFI